MDTESLHVVGRFFKFLMPGFETSLKIPPAFCKTLDLNSKKAVLKSSKGSWKVYIKKYDEEDGLLRFIGKNWENFVLNHELKLGYFVVFNHVGSLIFNILVYDETKCLKDFEVLEDEDEDEDEHIIEDDVVCLDDVQHIHGGEEILPCGSNQNVNSQFRTILKDSHIKGAMTIPKEFATSNGLKHKKRATLRNARGDSWGATLKFDMKFGRYECFRIVGISKFLRENKLKVGDTCLFELVHSSSSGDSDHVVMNVTF